MASQEHSLPPLVISVGVTGHRTHGLSEAGYDQETLRSSVRRVLTQIKETGRQFSLLTPDVKQRLHLIVVSPLAEGADRIVAREALALGYELQSPLPFSRVEYEEDFATDDSKAEFHAILERANAVIELEGSHDCADQAYEKVGRWVLRHSDILLAIWNGESAAGRGGTGQIVQESLTQGLPTVWIRPKTTCLLRNIQPVSYVKISILPNRIRIILDAKRKTVASQKVDSHA